MNNPYLFIVGCPRSGTTLIQRMVNAHYQVAITPESHWIPRFYAKPWALNPEGFVTQKLIRRLLAKPKFARLKLSEDELTMLAGKANQISYPELVSLIFDLYGKAQGKPLVGDKTPDYVRSIQTLHELWPSARFVHVIRDGRNVALSMMDWTKVHPKPGDFTTWELDSISTAAVWWELNVQLGRRAGKSLGPNLYYEIRYESLVNHPREESEALCVFLSVPYDDGMLRFHEALAALDPGLDATRARLPVTSGLRDWRSQMGVQDIESFEAAAGQLLDELGYTLAMHHLRPETVERAARIRTLLSHDPLVQE
jgi:Sulfotransferase family